MDTRDDLFQPTLGRPDSPATSIYSAQTGYLASFFGGPLAGATIALANAYRLKRLGTDWLLGLIAVTATVAPMWWWYRGGAEWTAGHAGGGMHEVGLRVLGLAFFALVYGWHRQYYRNMALVGLSPPSGWLIGVAAVLGSLVVDFGLAVVLS